LCCQFVEQLVGIAEGTYRSWSFCTRQRNCAKFAKKSELFGLERWPTRPRLAMLSVQNGHLLLQILESLVNLPAEVDELLVQVLQQAEQLGGGRAGMARLRSHPPRGTPGAPRPPGPRAAHRRRSPPLKSSRSKVRGGAAVGSAAVGMAGASSSEQRMEVELQRWRAAWGRIPGTGSGAA